ncbi:MAG: hypothetical protein ABFD97_21595 [Syntrophobacter sp.]
MRPLLRHAARYGAAAAPREGGTAAADAERSPYAPARERLAELRDRRGNHSPALLSLKSNTLNATRYDEFGENLVYADGP